MKALRDVPIKWKLTLISMLTSCVALVLTCGAIIGFQLVSSRDSMLREVLTTASIVGDNSAAALTFGDRSSAELTLKSLAAHEHIVAAVIYDADGRPFASYQTPATAPMEPPTVRQNSSRFTNDWPEIFEDRFTDDYLEVFRDISVAGEQIGTVYLRHDMAELGDELGRSLSLALSVMAAAAFVAFVVTRQLLPLVAGPIMGLGEVVRKVAAQKDFSVRAVKQGNDEVGQLIDGFNEMLGEIQHRDFALHAAQEGLERRVEERTHELERSLSVLNATLESTADGIVALDDSGRIVCYNSKFVAMWGFPPDMLQAGNDSELLAFATSQVVNPERFIRKTGNRAVLTENRTFDVVRLKDGRTFERYVQSQGEGEMPVGRVINYRDVTQRKRAEAELAEAARQLLETSRQAGMAEVATSVLHNVGNVLNSVNVSCAVVIDRIGKSRFSSVRKTADLLHRHTDDLAAFLTTDPTGLKLPEYLGKLAAGLAREQQETLQELRLLSKNIDHIKEIVSMQQNYAKVSGVTEALALTDLIEDSLQINEGSLTRHAVQIVRDYNQVPLVSVEKHKVLQILVNLIRNAKQACDNADHDKRITLRVSHVDEKVRVTVTDNGAGIPPENLTKIFAHGFTTKREGHGFGLHSGALAAAEMGGSLSVHSDGPGTGASFTLELPVEQ